MSRTKSWQPISTLLHLVRNNKGQNIAGAQQAAKGIIFGVDTIQLTIPLKQPSRRFCHKSYLLLTLWITGRWKAERDIELGIKRFKDVSLQYVSELGSQWEKTRNL